MSSKFAGLGTVDAVPPALLRREYPVGGIFHVEQCRECGNSFRNLAENVRVEV